MAEERYRDLLRRADDPTWGEWPPGYDRAMAEARFRVLAERIAQTVGWPCAVDADTQDASFLGDVVLPRELWNADGDPIFVRVSNFGGFATIGCYGGTVPWPFVDLLVPVLTSLSYVYVPEEALSEPYTGAFRWIDGDKRRTWWDRYFDWL